MNPETKTCQNCKSNFTIEPDDFGFYQKMKVPTPTFTPDRPEIVYCEKCYQQEVY